MNIQTNYINVTYTKPVFMAGPAMDPLTKNNMRQIVNTCDSSGYPMYLTLKSLENLNTEDKVSIRRPHPNVWVVNNTRTNDSIMIYRKKTDNPYLKQVMQYTYTCGNDSYADLPSALCSSIGNNVGILFRDLKGKNKILKRADGPIFDLNTPPGSQYKKSTDSYRIDNKIAECKAQIANLEKKKAENGRKYALSLIG